MEWTGEGLMLGTRRHGETSTIAEVMVVGRGRCLGLVRGGRSHKLTPTLQAGNSVQVTWRARLEDHLGNFTVELLQTRAADIMADRLRLYALQLICDHMRLLPERDPHDRLLQLALHALDHTDTPLLLGTDLARFELTLLEELGFGLDLASCAVSGETAGLTHVSPRTGRAVTAEVAAPYKGKLLELPTFLSQQEAATTTDLSAAFRLTGHFLAEHVWNARNISPPATRDSLIGMLAAL